MVLSKLTSTLLAWKILNQAILSIYWAPIAWDVTNGLSRRAWARNPGARFAIERAMSEQPGLEVTLPHQADEALVQEVLAQVGLDGSE